LIFLICLSNSKADTDSKENGWFESDYYYPVKFNPFKKAVGKQFDVIAVKIAWT
jgi:hypothetical protein